MAPFGWTGVYISSYLHIDFNIKANKYDSDSTVSHTNLGNNAFVNSNTSSV
jgi:hypothetical protein